MPENIQNAVLVGIQFPKTTAADVDSSLKELSRLVKTLGYSVVGQVTQKRNSERSVSILGSGKLKELAQWTGGSGEIASLVKRKLSKAKTKWLSEEEEGDEEALEEENVDDEAVEARLPER